MEDAYKAIKKRDKERVKKEAQAKQKMLDNIKKRERVVLYRVGVITWKCKKFRKEVILDGDIPLNDLSYNIFLKAILDLKK